MPYLLKELIINRVDLVDEGANSAAFIELYKRKERKGSMDIKEILAKMVPEHATVIQAEIDKLSDDVAKATASVTTLTEELQKAKEDLKVANEELATLKSSQVSFDETEVLKSMPEAARVEFLKMKAQKEAAEEEVRKAKEAEATSIAKAKAAELKALPIEQEKLIGILKSASPDLIEIFTAINNAIEGTTFQEIGKKSQGINSAEAAWAKIEAKAMEVAKAKGISKAKAITEVVNENPDLYKEYLKGGAN